MYSKREKEILRELLDRYERSRTYRQENQRNQSFSIRPEQVFPLYQSDYASIEEIADFENELDRLERENLIRVKTRGKTAVRIDMNPEMREEYYKILSRDEKNSRIASEIRFYENCYGEEEIINCFAREQIARLSAGKKAEYEPEEAKVLVAFLKKILSNHSELLERELSILVTGDSKSFEKNWRAKICRILQKYTDQSPVPEYVEKEREKEKIILEEYHIYPNPSYVYLKGNARIAFDAGEKEEYFLLLRSEIPMALSSDSLGKIRHIEVLDNAVMTVENLTSFNRIRGENRLYLYLGGYHNTVKRMLLKKIAADNPALQWLHFGDIDPDGFYILEDLKSATGIGFSVWKMTTEELEKYRESCKKLEKQDIVKARSLIAKGKYADALTYMLEQNCKLEQEIISLKESEDDNNGSKHTI